MTTDDRTIAERPLIDLGAYQRAIQRRWVIVVLLAVTAAAFGYLARGGDTFQSTAVLKVNAGLVSVSSGGSSAPNMATEKQVARSTSTTALAAEKLGTGLTATQFQRRATADTPVDASTIALTFQARTPEGAQLGATAWAEAYLESRRAGFERDLARTRQQLVDSLAPLEAQYAAAVVAAAAADPDTPEAARANASVARLLAQLEPGRSRIDSLNGIVIDPGEVISEPVVPDSPEGLSPTIYVAAGLLVGLLFGAVVAILLERRFGRVRNVHDVRGLLRVPAWAIEPRRNRGEPLDPALEAVAARLPDSWQTLVVTDLGPAASNATAERLAGVLRMYRRVEVVAPRELAHPASDALRLVAVRDVESPEAAAAMARADGVLLVVETGARLTSLASATRSIADSDANLVAAVLTTPTAGVSPRTETRSDGTGRAARGRFGPSRARPAGLAGRIGSINPGGSTDRDARRGADHAAGDDTDVLPSGEPATGPVRRSVTPSGRRRR